MVAALSGRIVPCQEIHLGDSHPITRKTQFLVVAIMDFTNPLTLLHMSAIVEKNYQVGTNKAFLKCGVSLVYYNLLNNRPINNSSAQIPLMTASKVLSNPFAL